MKTILFVIGILMSTVSIAMHAQPQDSVGVKEVNGQWYILHKVEKGEGLYAIARRYNADVESIKKANPDGVNGLQIGQIIMVPVAKPVAQKQEPAKEAYVGHVVKPGETLYAISKLYNVSVEAIKIKNKLSSNNLTVGQELIIKGEKPAEKPQEHVETYGEEEKPVKTQETKPVKAPE
ncbi:MAG: LysM peptidoglycan-binding domain-containing protein, partial [Bacteroidota bacterium]|nr:LysM peptidoglycan-binding domain-containing protein [Bacteroidota bacterium]MDX5430124.1 LysM peptidoglycan-binding domain-containing protein [Bacteroidota bacterium]MDX5468885.1 LysM peptidoglycan-binding domain-containing protein [Bacteroidota bacterium]